MALLGLGFSFGGKDDGLGKQLSSFTDSFKQLGKEILSLQRIQTFLAALSLDKLDQLGSKLQNLTAGGGELVSSLESEFKSATISATKFGVQTGLTAEAARKLGRDAFAMSKEIGVSADEAAKAIRGMQYASETTKKAFAAFGIESAKDLAKFAEQTGISADEFAYSQSQMQISLGLTDEQLAKLNAQAYNMGKESGDVAGALKAVADMQSKLLARKNIFVGQGMSAEEAAAKVTELAQSTFRAGEIFQKLGDPKGLDSASAIFDTLNETAGNFEGLLKGANAEYPELLKQLQIAGISSEDAFKSIQQGPTEFIQMIAKAVEGLQQAGAGQEQLNGVMSFFRAQVKSLPAEQVNTLANNLLDAGKRSEILGAKIVQTKEEAKAAGKALVKSYEDPRDAAQLYEEAVKGFMQRFRGMSTQTSGQFLKEARQSFKEFGDGLSAIHKDGGPLGLLLGKMADVQKFGAAGLLPKDMQAGAAAFGEVLDKLSGPFAKLKALGIDILSPTGVLAAGVGFLTSKFITLRGKGMTTEQALTQIGEDIIDFFSTKLPKYVDKGIEYLSKTADKILDSLMAPVTSEEGKKSMATRMGDAITKSLTKIWDTLKDLGEGFWKGISGTIEKTDPKSQRIGGAIGLALKKAYDYVVPAVKSFVTDLWSGLTGQLVEEPQKDGSSKQSFANKMGLWLRETGMMLWGYISAFASDLWKGMNNETVATVDKEGKTDQSFANKLGLWVRAAGEYALKEVILFVEDLWAGFSGNIVQEVNADGTTQQTVGNKIGVMLGNAFDTAVAWLKDYFKKWWEKVTTIMGDDSLSMEDKISKIFGESLPALIATSILAPGAISAIVGGLFSLAMTMMGFFFSILGMLAKEGILYLFKNRIGPWILRYGTQTLWPALSGAASTAWAGITSFFSATVWPFITGIGEAILTAITTVVGAITATVLIIVAIIVAAFVAFYYSLKEEGDDFSDTWDRMMSGISTTALWYWDYIKAGAMFVFDNIVIGLENAWELMKYAFKAGVLGVQIVFVKLYNFVAELFNGLANVMLTPFKLALDGLSKMLSFFIEKLAASPRIAEFFGIDKEKLENLKGASTALAGMGDSLKEAVKLKKLELPTDKLEGPQLKDAAKMREVESLASRQAKEWERIDAAKAARIAATEAEKKADEAKIAALKEKQTKDAEVAKAALPVAAEVKQPTVTTRTAAAFAAPKMEGGFLVATTPEPTRVVEGMAALPMPAPTLRVAEGAERVTAAIPAPMAIPMELPVAPAPKPAVFAQAPLQPVARPADMESQLIKATDNPQWVTNYIALVKQQHQEILNAMAAQATDGRQRSAQPLAAKPPGKPPTLGQSGPIPTP